MSEQDFNTATESDPRATTLLDSDTRFEIYVTAHQFANAAISLFTSTMIELAKMKAIRRIHQEQRGTDLIDWDNTDFRVQEPVIIQPQDIQRAANSILEQPEGTYEQWQRRLRQVIIPRQETTELETEPT